MIKRKIKILGVLFLSLGLFCITSCNSKTNGNHKIVVNSTDDINENIETKQKYVIELNMDNYLKFIDIKIIPSNNDYFEYYFQGSLSYAFYDNVVITSHYSRAGYEETDTEITLSAGGYAMWHSSGGKGNITVIDVKGKVIYWI